MAREVDITRPRAPQPRRATTAYGEALPPSASTPTTYTGPAPTEPPPANALTTSSDALTTSTDALTTSADDLALDLDLLDAPPPVDVTARETWRGQRSPIDQDTTPPAARSNPDTLRNQPSPLRRESASRLSPTSAAPASPTAPASPLNPPPSPQAAPQHAPSHAADDAPTERASVARLPAVLCEFAPFPDGWSSPRRLRRTDDGLLFNDLYTLPSPLPSPDGLTRHHSAASPSALQATRDAFPKLSAAALASPALLPLGYLLGGGLGALLAALVVTALCLAAGAALRLVSRWTQPRESEDPEETARQYIALLRLNLYKHARDLLALPPDASPVALSALLDTSRADALGPAFNVIGPVALRDYWRPRLALFDDPAWPAGLLASLTPSRRWHPGDIHIETLLSRADGDAALLVVQGHKRLSYAFLPLARVAGRWHIADGELHLRAADTESLRRLAALHNSGAIDDDQLARACAHLNLTRPDINLGLSQQLITERQAERIFSHMPAP
jgi:hypothetical protein